MASLAADCSTKLTRAPSDQSTASEQAGALKKLTSARLPVGLAKGPDLKNCKSKIGSLNNIKHTPKGGDVQIQSQKLKWNAKSKVGSLENKEHQPGGGKLKVETRKLEWKTTSKVQSLQNVNHKPGGGNVKIFNDSYASAASPRPPKTTGDSNDDSATESGGQDKLQAEFIKYLIGDWMTSD